MGSMVIALHRFLHDSVAYTKRLIPIRRLKAMQVVINLQTVLLKVENLSWSYCVACTSLNPQ